MTEIKSEGLPELLARFRDLPNKIINGCLRPSLRAGTKVEATAIKADLPVDTGNYAKSIKVRSAKRKRNRIGFMAQISKANFPKSFYPAPIEFGWKRKLAKGAIKMIPGKHYVKNAMARVESQTLNEVESVARTNFEKAAAK